MLPHSEVKLNDKSLFIVMNMTRKSAGQAFRTWGCTTEGDIKCIWYNKKEQRIKRLPDAAMFGF